MSLILPFQKCILSELLKDDGLVVLSPGLNLLKLISELIRVYHINSPKALIILLNFNDKDKKYLKLMNNDMFYVLNDKSNVQKRKKMYAQGGCICISARILIVDLLNKVLPTSIINGMIINNCHNILESNNIDFILRLYRGDNSDINKPNNSDNTTNGFIKAFSNRPTKFMQGFFKIEKVLNILNINSLYLWPRFRIEIKNDLKNGPKVFELNIPLTSLMIQIQNSFIEVIHTCLTELEQSCTDHPIYFSIAKKQLTLEKILSTNIYEYVKRQLKPIWHKISSRSKILSYDIGTLWMMLNYLITYDCVLFLRYFHIIRKSYGTRFFMDTY